MLVHDRIPSLTRWSAKNAALAAWLLAALAVLTFGVGAFVGNRALPKLPIGVTTFLILVLFSGIYITQRRSSELIGEVATRLHKWQLMMRGNWLIFMGIYALSMVAGNLQQSVKQQLAFQHDSVLMAAVTYDDTKINISEEELFKGLQDTTVVRAAPNTTAETEIPEKSDGNRRLMYFLLFVAGLGLTYLSALISCNLACSGYGVLAAAVVLIGLGALSASFYFLLKVFRNGYIKKWKEMNADEKRRERKMIIRGAAIMAGVLALYLISIGIIQR